MKSRFNNGAAFFVSLHMQFFSTFMFLSVMLLNCNHVQDKHQLISSGIVTNGSMQIPVQISTGKTTPSELITYARSLLGIPYKYGSADPQQGFDCSGFITYVFNHFGIAVPRSSIDFGTVRREINLKEAKTGDLILFTGTDSTIKTIGHMGILIVEPNQGLKFIHSTSGKAYGVTETLLNAYYMGRYLKTIRVFQQNDR